MDAIVDVMANIATIALTWLPLVFFGLIVYLLWRSPRAHAAGEADGGRARFEVLCQLGGHRRRRGSGS